MSTVELVGRILFAAVFVISPVGVLRQAQNVAAAPPLRWMGSRLAVLVISASCVMAIGGAGLIILGLWPDLGAVLLLGFLIPVTLTMHRFWQIDDPHQRAIKRGAFVLNTSLVGANLLYLCFVNQTQHISLGVLAEPLFDRW